MNPFGVAPTPQIDLIALARWNHANERARDAYYAETTGVSTYAQKTAASQKQLRYRARKKGLAA